MNPQEKEKQFIEAYDNYSDAIYRHCYYRVFDEERAKDYVQEAYSRTWKYLAAGKEVENIRAFLYRTANNIIIDESRKKKSVSLNVIMEKGFSPSADQRKITDSHLAHKEVLEVIDSLDEKYRDIIIMKYVDGFSPKEIAQIKEETENNVYVRIHRGLEKVKEILKEKELAQEKKQI